MSVTFGLFLLATCIIGIVLMLCAFAFYIFNRRRYNELVNIYVSEGWEFPMPYSFQSKLGFFGSYPVSKFFLCLKGNKRNHFLSIGSNAYDFFKKHDPNLINWMIGFCRLWKYAVILVVLPCLAAVLHSYFLTAP